jgi:hypothetical protein
MAGLAQGKDADYSNSPVFIKVIDQLISSILALLLI